MASDCVKYDNLLQKKQKNSKIDNCVITLNVYVHCVDVSKRLNY